MTHYEDIEPIKDKNKMRNFENELLNHGKRPKEIYVAWQIGKVCLLRVSDVLKLKYDQVYQPNGKAYDTVITHDQKTKKYNPLNLAPLKHQHILSDYRDWRLLKHIHSVWMFPSTTNMNKPISRIVVYRLLKKAADMLGYKNIGCHSARKTGAYLLYEHTGHDIGLVSKMLNHSSEAITYRYLGINSPRMKQATDTTDWF